MSKNQLPILPFGAQYYRCPTPHPDAWESDLRNMAAAGFNTIKIWAVWRTNNPQEGVYDWSDLDALMGYAQQFGLKVIINTIFDAAPAWFFQKYPESVMVTNDEGPIFPREHACRQMGGCPGPCLHHREGQRIRREFLHELVARYADHPALLCWDLWNEPELTVCIKRELRATALVCYCPQSEADFKVWLEKKYGSIEEVNRVWGRNYNDFSELELPRTGDTFKDMVDWRLFMTDTITDEVRLRIDAAREMDKVHPMMVHTVTIPFFPAATCGSDDYAIAKECDIFGNSVGSEPLSAGITLSAAPGKMVINSEIHAVGGSTYQRPKWNTLRDMKRHIYVPLAAGIKGFVFWQYRAERLGIESPAWGLTDLAGRETPWMRHAADINHALQQNSELLLHSAPAPAKIGVLNSQRTQLFDFCVSKDQTWYIRSVKGAHAMLRAAGYNVDLVGDLQMTDEFLAKYRVLYDPFPYYKDGTTCEVLRRWVANGGVLLSEATFGSYSDDDGLHTMEQPGFGFADLFGAEEDRITTASSFENAYGNDWSKAHDRSILEISGAAGKAGGYHFYQSMTPTTGKAIAQFTDGSTAAVCNDYGKGKGIWIGSLLAYAYEAQGVRENADFVAALLAEHAGITPLFRTPKGVRADLLSAPEGQLLVVDNPTADTGATLTAIDAQLNGTVLENILTGETIVIKTVDGQQTVCAPVEAGGIEVYRVR